jgi:ferredoxin
VNTTFIAMGVATFIAVNILLGMGALSLLTGAFHFLFIKPKLQFLKSEYGPDGFAFGFSWDQTIESARFNQIKLHLFNPFGEPTQLEITRDFDAHGEDFAVDLNLGAPLRSFVTAKGFENATIEIEMTSSQGGITHLLSMKGKSFLEKLNTAANGTNDVADFSNKHKSVKTKPLFVAAPDRSFVSGPLPKTGKALKLATNPEFQAQFAASGGDAATISTVANFSLSKIWIEPGCIVCDACAGIFPEVFEVTDKTCIIRPDAPLTNGIKVQEAAEACPVEIIKFTKI